MTASQGAPSAEPMVFMSYSHDTPDHKAWVRSLATRLRSNGADVYLDEWNVTLGGNLTAFMERAADPDYRVVAVVSAEYARKADARIGGAGVETQLLSADLYDNLDSDRVIPLLRNNPGAKPALPAFLLGRRFTDFRDDAVYEERYEELARDILGERINVAPPLGPNPFKGKTAVQARLELRNSPSRWQNAELSGEVEFVYTQNSGNYQIGSSTCSFTLDVGVAGPHSVYVHRGGSTSHVSIIERVGDREHLLQDVAQFDNSSRYVHVEVGDAVVLHNPDGYWALVRVLDVFQRQALNDERVIRFQYVIKPDRSTDFR